MAPHKNVVRTEFPWRVFDGRHLRRKPLHTDCNFADSRCKNEKAVPCQKRCVKNQIFWRDVYINRLLPQLLTTIMDEAEGLKALVIN